MTCPIDNCSIAQDAKCIFVMNFINKATPIRVLYIYIYIYKYIYTVGRQLSERVGTAGVRITEVVM